MKYFRRFWKKLMTDIQNYSKEEMNKIEEETIKEAIKVFEKAKSDIKRLYLLFVEGKLTYEELECLIKVNKNLDEIVMLRQKGWTKDDLYNFLDFLYMTISCTLAETALE